MTGSEFVIELKKIQEASTTLRTQFLEENAVFAVGERVMIVNKNRPEKSREAEVRAVLVSSYDGDITYKLRKVKKDGTLSKHEDYVWGMEETIEKL